VAEERARQLQLLTQRLASALSREEIGNVVIGQAHEYLGATASVAYFEALDGTMCLAASRGVTADSIRTRAILDLDAPLPLCRVIRTGKPLWLRNRAEILDEFPDLAATTESAPLEALAAIALHFGEHTLGGIAFSFPRPMELDEPTRSLVTTFALQCAQALERARLYDQERRARARLEILADTSDRLSKAQLDLTAVLDTICREVANRMPESCTVNLVPPGGDTLELAAVHHIDPEAEAGIRATLNDTPARIGEGMLGRVAETGQSMFVPIVDFQAMLAATKPQYRPHLERFPVGGILIVPLRVADRVIGTITASRHPSRPRYTVEDHRLLQDIADRSAFAIENARLFQAEQHARRLRDDFLSIAGHELRTPLTALQLQVETLRSAPAIKPELLADRLNKTLRHVKRLDALITQLLDVTQLTRGRLALTPERVDAQQLAFEIVDRYREQARRASCEITCHGASVIGMWDRSRLDQVITNVLGNAIKYGAGHPIDVRVAREGTHCRITVHDRGLGIDPSARERIFDRFERAISDRNYGGLGLGLWISRQIVDALGGKITFESKAGVGTTFDIALPLGDV